MVISDRTARRYVGYVPTMISVIMLTAPVPRAVPRDGRGQTASRVSNIRVPLAYNTGRKGQKVVGLCLYLVYFVVNRCRYFYT